MQFFVKLRSQDEGKNLNLKNQGKHRFDKFREDLSQESYSAFFDYYFTRLVQFAFTILKSELLAEEIVLDVFMRLWEQKRSLSKINNIETYLFISVRNSSINALKKEKKFHLDMLDDSHVPLAGYKPSAETDLIGKEMMAALNEAIGQLPAKCRIIFKLIREDGLNRNEVAEILDVSVKTVDNQIAIAVRKIAEKLNIDLTVPKNRQRLLSVLLTL